MATYTNMSILQGWFEIESLETVTQGRTQVPLILGWIYTTDEEGVEQVFSERHPVLIADRPAQAILEITRKLSEKYAHIKGINLVELTEPDTSQSQILIRKGRPFVIAQGKLLTYEGRSYVDVKHISFLGLPWGALEALAETEGRLNPDTRA
jgi:hypothetical protein